MARPTNSKDKKTPAVSPFDRSDADLILSTSDGVDFRVHTQTLKMASPVFDDMFGFPTAMDQDSDPQSLSEIHSSLPNVQVTETSYIFDIILRTIYPVSTPKVTSSKTLCDVLKAGSKYQMEDVMTQMSYQLLVHFLKDTPFKVYAIACQYQLEDAARGAARALDIKVKPKDVEKDWVSDIHRMTAGQLFSENYTFTHKDNFPRIKHVNFIEPDFHHPIPLDIDPSVFTTNNVDIIVRSKDQHDFSAHRLLLASQSPVLEQRLQSIEPNGILELAEDSSTASLILKMLYSLPLPPASFSRIDLLCQTTHALKNYKMDYIVERAKELFLDPTKVHALEAYFIAIACGWKKEASQLAKTLLSFNSLKSLYVVQMENISAKAYQRLLSFYAKFRQGLIPIIVESEDLRLDVFVGLIEDWNQHDYTNERWKEIGMDDRLPMEKELTELQEKVDKLKKSVDDIKLNDIIAS
ncbi:hypothetical protein ABKN59_010991 [Abortiporus biennis]